jgi:hypothetical protein
MVVPRLKTVATRATFAFGVLVLVAFGVSDASAIVPSIYYSPADDGVPEASPPGSLSHGVDLKLPLYMNGGATSSTDKVCDYGDGDEVCAYKITLSATGAVTFKSFDGVGEYLANVQATEVTVAGGDPVNGSLGPTKLGDLYFDATDDGAIALVAAQTVDADLTLVSPITGGLVFVVPEPGLLASLAASAMALTALATRRRP